MQEKILITGANGNLGKAIIKYLLTKVTPGRLVAMVKDLSKGNELQEMGVEVRQGDYLDYQSLVNAFNGVNKLLLISSSNLEGRTQQHVNVINAAKEKGGQHVFYTSVSRNSMPTYIPFVVNSHLETEEYLRATGLTYTILRNGIYMDAVTLYIGNNVAEQGAIYFPAGNGKVNFVARVDLAEATANILLDKNSSNTVYELNANVTYSFNDVAEAIGKVVGKGIKYFDVSSDAYRSELAKLNVPPPYIELLIGFAEAFKEGEFDTTDPALETVLGRKPVSLAEHMKQAYQITKED